MSNREKDEKIAQLGEEAYQSWLNQPPIQFPRHPSSPIRNAYIDNNSSHVRNGGNEVDIGMDELLRQMSVMDAMLFHTF